MLTVGAIFLVAYVYLLLNIDTYLYALSYSISFLQVPTKLDVARRRTNCSCFVAEEKRLGELNYLYLSLPPSLQQ